MVTAESFLHAVLFARMAKSTTLFLQDGWIARRVTVGTTAELAGSSAWRLSALREPTGATGAQGPQGSRFNCATQGETSDNMTVTTAQEVGTLTHGASFTATGVSSGEHWYKATWLAPGTAFAPTIYLSSGPPYYVLDVYSDAAGTPLPRCVATAPLNAEPAVGQTIWHGSPSGTTTGACLSPGSTTYVRVRPLAGNRSCFNYTVVFQNF